MEAVVQVTRTASGGRVETELGWRRGVMEKKDVPVWNLLSGTLPKLERLLEAFCLEEGKAMQGDGLVCPVSL